MTNKLERKERDTDPKEYACQRAPRDLAHDLASAALGRAGGGKYVPVSVEDLELIISGTKKKGKKHGG